MNTNYFEKLEQIVDKLMEKHIPLSARNIEESKEILALCQYYKISRALAKESEQQSNCNLPKVSVAFKCPEVIYSLLVLSNMVSEICIDEDIPIEIKVKIKSSFAIIQKEITDNSVNKECVKIVV